MEQKFFVASGVLILLYSLLISFGSFYTGSFPAGHDVGLFGVSVMCFCLAYLYPQFKENDERSKRIKEKGMFISYFFIMGYMIIFMALFQLHIITLDGYQTISILAALIIMTVFLSFVIYSKRY